MLDMLKKRVAVLLVITMLVQLFAGVSPILAEDLNELNIGSEFVSIPILTAILAPGEIVGATTVTVTDYVYGELFVNITEQEIEMPRVGDTVPRDGDNLITGYEPGADIAAGVAAGNYLQIYDVDMEEGARIVAFYQAKLAEKDIKEADIKGSLEEEPTGESTGETIGETAADQDEGPAEEMEDTDGRIGEDKSAGGLMTFGITPMSTGTVIGTYTLGANVTGTLYSDGELVIFGTGSTDNYSFLKPSPFNHDSIKSVVINGGVTTIGNYMFNNCISLTSVAIPDSVTSIGKYTFGDCTSLGIIEIPDSVTSIEENAFIRSSLASINIPNSIKNIGQNAFQGTSLTSIAFPNSVTCVEPRMFSTCKALTSATIPAVTSIGLYAFSECTNLTTLSVPIIPPTVENYAFNYCPTDRKLIIVDNTGAALTGTALISAQQAYRAVDDGNTGDNYWYGWTIAQPITPTAADFTYNFTSPIYTGSSQAVTVTSSKTGMGSITIKYNGSTTAPVNAGTYSITIDVAQGESYTALNSLSLGTYKIEKATPVVVGTAQDITNVQPKNPITMLTGITVNGVNGLIEGSWQGTAPADYNTTQNVTMTFTPNDTTNYNNVTTTVSVTTKPTYTVAFNANGGTGTPPIQAATPENFPFTLPNNPFVKNGYYFAGWHDGTTLYSPSAVYTMPARNITFTARWTVRSYNITYDLDGGTSGTSPTSYNIETPTITLKNANRTGYTFEGWFDAATEGNKVMSIPQGSTGDKALYARWTPNTNTAYQVLHYQQNVSGAGYTLKDTDNLSGTTATTVNASAKAYTGFTENSSHTDRVASGSIAADGGLILKLYYDRNTHTVSFASNGGDAIAGITGVRYGATIVAPAAPSRTGYTFTGWYKEAGLTSAWGFTTDTVTASMTLYAKWTVNQYTIIFKSNGGSNVAPITQGYGTAVTKPANPTRAGYTFKAWNPALPATMPAANTTLAAQWDLVSYNITYELGGGTGGANPTSYNIESAAITLGNATKIGYTFAGWFDAATQGNKITSIPHGSTGNKELYARWTPNNYTVTFDANGGGTPSHASKVVTYDSVYGILATVTRVDYNFKGWFTTASGGTEITAAALVKITSGQTLYARWEEKPQLTITVNSDSKVYDGAELTNAGWDLTSGTLATGDSLEVTVTGSITDAGTAANAVTLVKIMRGTTDVTEYYNIDKVNGQLQITKRPVVLTSVSTSKTYDGAPLTKPEVTITGDGFVAGEATASATGSVTKVGSVVNIIVISKGASYKDTNYAITWHHGDLKITKNTAAIAITADSGTWTYDGQLHSKDTYQTTGLLVGFQAEAVITGDITDFGTASNIVTSYVIKLGEEDVTNQFGNITTHNGTLEITKRPLGITAASDSKTYDGTELINAGYSITSGSLADNQTLASVTVAGSQMYTGSSGNAVSEAMIKDVGNKDVTGNYAITYEDGTLTVTKAEIELTITATRASKVYDGTELANNGWTKTGDLATGDSLSVTVEGSITDYGTTANTISFVKIMHDTTDVTENYNINKVNGTLTITKRPVTLTSESGSKEYDGTPLIKPDVAIMGDGFVEGEATVSATGTITKVGSVVNIIVINKSAGYKDINYAINWHHGDLAITKNTTAIVITADNGTWTYDGQLHSKDTFQATGLPEGFQAEAIVTGDITNFGTAENIVTSYGIKLGEEDVTNQFSNITTHNGTLEITKRPLEITAASDSKTYDGTKLTNAGCTITSGNLADNQTLIKVTVTGSQLYAGISANAASEAVIKDASDNNVTGNYEITYIDGTLEVAKAEIKITVIANSASKVYDGTELTNTGWELTSGTLATGDSLQVTVAGSITDTGTAENVVTEVKVMHDTTDVTENYNTTTQNGILTVTARPLEITAASDSKTYDGTELINAGYSITSGNLADNQTLIKVTVTGSQLYSGSSTNKASGAVIKDTGKNDVTGNYEITYIAGTLVINSRSSERSPASKTTREGIDILINGKTETAATATTTQQGGKTIIAIVVDDKKIEEKLEQEGNNTIVTIPVTRGADVVIVTLNGQTVKNMESKDAVLEIKTGQVTYTLPASQINIDDVSEQIGKQIKLKDIDVSVNISEPAADTVKIVEDTANRNNFQIIMKPVEFKITCSSEKKTVEVSIFNKYVEKMIAIPEGADPSKVTTGVILNIDGSFSHVPTVITIIDGKYYARINSLTNSVYSAIYSPKTFRDVERHWAKDDVNDMASRLVVNGFSDDNFEPDRDITRAEFTAITVRALGLMKPGTEDTFNDVLKGTWYYDAVSKAYEYGLIAGYKNGKFSPMDKITREQAMTIAVRATKITGLKTGLADGETDKLLESFVDANSVAEYAKANIASCIKTGMILGKDKTILAPKDNITRAEAAVIIRRLLQLSGLI